MIIYSRDVDNKSTLWNSKKMTHVARVGGVITSIVDRTGNMNTHQHTYDPIPNMHSGWPARNFNQCVSARARQLWASIPEDKEVWVSWSGGIDSTVAYIAMRLAIPLGRNLHILYTPESVNEHPTFWRERIRYWNGSVPHIFDKAFYDRDDVVVISGNCGDAIFGTDISFLKDRQDVMQDPIEDIYNWDIDDLCTRHGKESERMEIVDAVLEYCDHSPVEIKTIFDMYWWINFNSKWMHVQRKIPVKYAQSTNWQNYISFFNSPSFQLWSLYNQEEGNLYQKKFTDYKWQAKHYIYANHCDSDYRDHKEVQASGLKMQPVDDMGPGMIKLLLDDGSVWHRNELIKDSICTTLLS